MKIKEIEYRPWMKPDVAAKIIFVWLLAKVKLSTRRLKRVCNDGYIIIAEISDNDSRLARRFAYLLRSILSGNDNMLLLYVGPVLI